MKEAREGATAAAARAGQEGRRHPSPRQNRTCRVGFDGKKIKASVRVCLRLGNLLAASFIFPPLAPTGPLPLACPIPNEHLFQFVF